MKDQLQDRRMASSPLELEAELRRAPDDLAISQLWAEALREAGDPRGMYVALDHAIRTARDAGDFAHALEVSREQARLLAERASEIVGRPGGFPYRESFEGRELIRMRSEPFHIPSLKPAQAFPRIQAFLRRFGEGFGPKEIHFEDSTDRAYAGERDPSVEPTMDDERAFLALLPSAQLFRSVRDEHTYVRWDPHTPIPDEAALSELVMRTKTLTLVYAFRHAREGTLLPYQEESRQRHASSLRLMPHKKQEIGIDFMMPFETMEDPAFVAYYDAVASALGGLPLAALSFSIGQKQTKPPKGFGKKSK